MSTNHNSNKHYIHPTSIIDKNVSIGKGSKIWHFSHVQESATIGKNCIIGQNVNIGSNVSIGNNVKIQNNVSVYSGVTIEDDVFCGPSCVFTNVHHPRAFIERKNNFLPTVVKKGASIGANATIICGVTIGKYAFIGAGALVSKDVTDHALVIGTPSKQVGWVCQCGSTLNFDSDNKADCKECSNQYVLNNNTIKAT